MVLAVGAVVIFTLFVIAWVYLDHLTGKDG